MPLNPLPPGPAQGAAGTKDSLYTDLSVEDRTFIELVQSLITSGNYLPGPLIMDIAREATDQIMLELNLSTKVPEHKTGFWRAQGR